MATITKFKCDANLDYISFVFNTVEYICESPVSLDDYRIAMISHKSNTLNNLMKSKCDSFMFSQDYIYINVDNQSRYFKRFHSYMRLYSEPLMTVKETEFHNKSYYEILQSSKHPKYDIELMSALSYMYGDLYKEASNNESYNILLRYSGVSFGDLFSYLQNKCDDYSQYLMCLLLADRLELPNHKRWRIDYTSLSQEQIKLIIAFYCQCIKYDNKKIYDVQFVAEFDLLCSMNIDKMNCIRDVLSHLLSKRYSIDGGIEGLATLLKYV